MGLVSLHLRKRVRVGAWVSQSREQADLFQAGCVALVRAAARYRPEVHGSFAAFALPRIRGAVFTALHEHFATIRVPVQVIVQHRRELARHRHPCGPALPTVRSLDLTRLHPALAVTADVQESPTEPTVREHIRLRFEKAITEALAELRERKWPQRNPHEAMSCIAAGRLLITEATSRTPLRQIGSALGISSGRLCEYESTLRDAVKRHLAADPQLPLLVRFANEDRRGTDSPVTADRRELLIRADVAAFCAKLVRLSRSERAEMLYRLIEESGEKPEDLLRKLYRSQLDAACCRAYLAPG